MPYTIKTVRTRPTIDVPWTSPELEQMIDEYEDVFNQVDQETSEDGLTSTTIFVVDVYVLNNPKTEKNQFYYDKTVEYRRANGITRKVTVTDENGNVIDSRED